MSIELESAYEARKYENEIYRKWEASGSFTPKIDPKKKPFTIMLPPPNATGKLHLGHATMLAVEDIMIRYHRMKGFSALWVPGTDHAAIATQSVVEKELQEKGIKNPRKELGREKLLKEIEKFVEESKDNIRMQMRKMGASCDWSRERYTLEETMNHAVNTLFEYMHEDGLIYRGGRIVNWDPKMETTVADDELEYSEETAHFYYFQFGPVVIGTARPETKFQDKIIVVHPKDKRYTHLIGKEFTVEWIEGKVAARVIADECIDMKLGTGAMTITPAHSLIDFELAQKYGLETPQIIDFEGKIRKDVSKKCGGMDIEKARKEVVHILEKKGLLVKIDPHYVHNIAVNYRGKGKIEPQVMKQWFIDVQKPVINWKGKKQSIKEVLQDTVSSKMITLIPSRFNKIYFHWIDNLRDWCISRQIWWGHQIPVWYKGDQYKVGAHRPEEKGEWTRDPDTLDTWFSSALWTFATLGWPKKTKELEYFHPTSVLETGYDILFFWVARMILASTYALRRDKIPEEKAIPFKTVYLHGLIRDRHGKKMSKSSPETCIDPLDMIELYGADALRLSLTIGATAGNDMRLYEEKIAGYRNFVNKIWNASRFALMNISEKDLAVACTPKHVKTGADKWILAKLQKLIKEVNRDIKAHRYSDAGTKIYDFFWSNYCDWYLEISKGSLKNPQVLLYVLKETLKLLHPFTPFVTEKIWEQLKEPHMLIDAQYPEYQKNYEYPEAKEMEYITQLVTEIRKIRAELKVEPAKKIDAVLYGGRHTALLKENAEIITRLARLETLTIKSKGPKIANSQATHLGEIELYLPLKGMIDMKKEHARLEKEYAEAEKLHLMLTEKLKNPGFLKNAPAAVLTQEKDRLAEAKLRMKKLKTQLCQTPS